MEVEDEDLMFRLIRASFNQRRKTLQNSIANSPELPFSKGEVAAALTDLGIAETIRGEKLGLRICGTGECVREKSVIEKESDM